MIEQHPIGDRADWLALREHDVTASAAAALLGMHPWLTAYGLWAEKSGAISLPDDSEITEAQERGLELEPIAVRRLKKMFPTWEIWQPNIYFRDPERRLGATPDALATDPERSGELGVIQIKSVEPSVFRQRWHVDGEQEPPLWIVVQALIEAELTGAAWAAVAALVIGYGIKLHYVEVPLHPGIIERVAGEVAAFWRMIDEGRHPDPDYGRDARLIEQLFEPGAAAPLDLTSDNQLPVLLDERESVSSSIAALEKRRREIKAELLTKLDDHGAALCADGRVITAKRVNKKGFEVKPTSFVDVRVRMQLQERKA